MLPLVIVCHLKWRIVGQPPPRHPLLDTSHGDEHRLEIVGGTDHLLSLTQHKNIIPARYSRRTATPPPHSLGNPPHPAETDTVAFVAAAE